MFIIYKCDLSDANIIYRYFHRCNKIITFIGISNDFIPALAVKTHVEHSGGV